MSNPQLETEPSDKTVLISALGWIGVIFVFLFVVAVAYFPNRSQSTEEQNIEIRMEIRNNVVGEQTRLVNAYEWINQEEGIVRIPVERAMELTVQELRAEANETSFPAP